MCIVLVLVFVFFTEIGLINIPQVFQKFESQVFLRLTRKQSYKKRFKIYYKSQVLFVKLYFLFNRFRIFTIHFGTEICLHQQSSHSNPQIHLEVDTRLLIAGYIL